MAKQPKKKKNYNNVRSTHPMLCPDGKYRWVYSMPMLKNPTILFEVYWVLAVSFGVVWLFTVLLGCCSSHMKLEDFWGITRGFLLLTAFFFVLGFVAYFFVAWYYGWNYSVLFIMDENDVEHKLLPSEVSKARTIGKLTALAGAASGKPAMVGLGIQAAKRTSMKSGYDSVRRLIPCPRLNVIKVRERFSRNMVFAADEDFDFVYQFLCDHCPNARKG